MIYEIQALLTITIPIVSNWQTEGDSRLAQAAYCREKEKVVYDFKIDPSLSMPLKS